MSISIRIDKTIYQVIWQHLCIAWLIHLHATQHLSNDNLDMFVIDIHTGVTIDALHLFDQVHLYSLASLNAQHILWVALATGNGCACRNLLARIDHNVTCGWDWIGTLLALLKAN